MNTTAGVTPLLELFATGECSPTHRLRSSMPGAAAASRRRGGGSHRTSSRMVSIRSSASVSAWSAAERLGTVHYHALYLGLPDDDVFVQRRRESPPPNHNPWSRLSASRAMEILTARQPDHRRQGSGGHAPAIERLADPAFRTGITGFALTHGVGGIDFLKIDVDGDDYAVLRSAEDILGRVLGISIEVNVTSAWSNRLSSGA